MKRAKKLRYRLLAPLVYLVALIFLVEEWFWDLGARLVSHITSWPPVQSFETKVKALSPYGALATFVMPAVLLFPVKLIALIAMANGHALAGICVIIVAKVCGAAFVARIYTLTRPTLLSLPWFARWHAAFMRVRDRWVGRLRATRAYRHAGWVLGTMRASGKALLARMRALMPARRQFGARASIRPARILRRFIAIWRSRHRS